MRRLLFVDVLRGVAILFMVIDHAYDWWTNAASHATVWGNLTKFIGTLAAPLFLFLVGVSLMLRAEKDVTLSKPRSATTIELLRRGLTLFLWGFLLNLLVFYTGRNIQDLLGVDILQLIGLSVRLAVPLIWMPIKFQTAAFIVVVIAGQTADRWLLPGWLDPFITGNEGISYFPLALWFPYIIAGLVFGQVLRTFRVTSRVMLLIVVIGLLSIPLIQLIDLAWGYRHPRPVFVLFSFIFISWLVAMVWFWTEKIGHPIFAIERLRDLGQASLMVYVLHHLIGYRLFQIIGWVHGRSWYGEYGEFTFLEASILFIFLIILLVLASQRWITWREKHGIKEYIGL